LVGS